MSLNSLSLNECGCHLLVMQMVNMIAVAEWLPRWCACREQKAAKRSKLTAHLQAKGGREAVVTPSVASEHP
eukprot:COSAG04_NODE_7_length_45988_cov_220.188869_16_plen_71_part_00